MKKAPLTKRYKKNPLFKGLDDSLKEKDRYIEVEKQLRDVMFSDHTHASLKGFQKCKRCIAKHEKRLTLIKDIGFKSIEQYLEWKKVMSIIIAEQSFRVA